MSIKYSVESRQQSYQIYTCRLCGREVRRRGQACERCQNINDTPDDLEAEDGKWKR